LVIETVYDYISKRLWFLKVFFISYKLLFL
jgi:hypothetical protein